MWFGDQGKGKGIKCGIQQYGTLTHTRTHYFQLMVIGKDTGGREGKSKKG